MPEGKNDAAAIRSRFILSGEGHVEGYIADWLNLLVRWIHLITGIAWIGASLYFVWLDNHLLPPVKPADHDRGVLGEVWSVHGGGFYHAQKYLLGPSGEKLSAHLHWFKWEAYATWLSGMGMLAVVYWWGANAYLIDRSVLDLTPAAAIAISAGTLAAGWFVYDALCRSIKDGRVLGGLIFVLLVGAAWGYSKVFGGRAAYVHVGALMGTLMVWNVYFHIIPGQRKMVEAIRAGLAPDPRYGAIGKQRSVQNTYFTPPVLFVMISNHYPMTYGHPYGWMILAAIGVAGALVRYWFVLRHQSRPSLALPLAALAIIVALAALIAPRMSAAPVSAVAGVSFAQVRPIIAERCAVCHAARPSFPGMLQPPAGVLLDAPEHIKAAASRIHQQAIATQTMPLGNLTRMTPEERDLLGRWLAAGAPVE
jgi:uncharacterized membrane protein